MLCQKYRLYDETEVYTEIYYHRGNLYNRRPEREARGRLYRFPIPFQEQSNQTTLANKLYG